MSYWTLKDYLRVIAYVFLAATVAMFFAAFGVAAVWCVVEAFSVHWLAGVLMLWCFALIAVGFIIAVGLLD